MAPKSRGESGHITTIRQPTAIGELHQTLTTANCIVSEWIITASGRRSDLINFQADLSPVSTTQVDGPS